MTLDFDRNEVWIVHSETYFKGNEERSTFEICETEGVAKSKLRMYFYARFDGSNGELHNNSELAVVHCGDFSYSYWIEPRHLFNWADMMPELYMKRMEESNPKILDKDKKT